MSDSRCPRCGAVRRPGDQWCGLCYADFREAPPPVVGDGAPPAPAPDAAAPPLIRPPGEVAASPQPSAPTPTPQVPTLPTQTAASAARHAAAPFVPSTNPLAPSPAVPTQLPAGVAPTASAEMAAAMAQAGLTEAQPAEGGAVAQPDDGRTWPCTRCGSDVPMSEDMCPACGAGFLEGAHNSQSVKVPLVGDVGKLNSGQKLLLGVSVGTVIILVIVAMLFIGGHIFK